MKKVNCKNLSCFEKDHEDMEASLKLVQLWEGAIWKFEGNLKQNYRGPNLNLRVYFALDRVLKLSTSSKWGELEVEIPKS